MKILCALISLALLASCTPKSTGTGIYKTIYATGKKPVTEELDLEEIVISAQNGSAHNQYFAASAYQKKGEYAEAIKWYKAAIAQNYYKAFYGLGTLYSKGRGVALNHSKALKLYLQSIEKSGGDIDIYNVLGKSYRQGLGTSVDYSEAIKWYKKSAKRNDTLGQAALANLYKKGYGFSQSDIKAYAWYKLASAPKKSSQNRIVNIKTVFQRHADNMNREDIIEGDKLARKFCHQYITSHMVNCNTL